MLSRDRPLNKRELAALKWVAESPWRTAWWGGKPIRWPSVMGAAVFKTLRSRGLVSMQDIGDRYDKIVTVTALGRAEVEKP